MEDIKTTDEAFTQILSSFQNNKVTNKEFTNSISYSTASAFVVYVDVLSTLTTLLSNFQSTSDVDIAHLEQIQVAIKANDASASKEIKPHG